MPNALRSPTRVSPIAGAAALNVAIRSIAASPSVTVDADTDSTTSVRSSSPMVYVAVPAALDMPTDAGVPGNRARLSTTVSSFSKSASPDTRMRNDSLDSPAAKLTTRPVHDAPVTELCADTATAVLLPDSTSV